MKITLSIPDSIIHILDDENVQRAIYGKMYEYYKNKKGRRGITYARTIRMIVAQYLLEHGFMNAPIV